MIDIKGEIGHLFNSITYPQDKIISSNTTDQYLIGYNKGWNDHRASMWNLLVKIYNLIDIYTRHVIADKPSDKENK